MAFPTGRCVTIKHKPDQNRASLFMGDALRLMRRLLGLFEWVRILSRNLRVLIKT
ncbi:hypothetical protein [Azospirillum doebereinerae]